MADNRHIVERGIGVVVSAFVLVVVSKGYDFFQEQWGSIGAMAVSVVLIVTLTFVIAILIWPGIKSIALCAVKRSLRYIFNLIRGITVIHLLPKMQADMNSIKSWVSQNTPTLHEIGRHVDDLHSQAQGNSQTMKEVPQLTETVGSIRVRIELVEESVKELHRWRDILHKAFSWMSYIDDLRNPSKRRQALLELRKMLENSPAQYMTDYDVANVIKGIGEEYFADSS